MSNQQPQKTSYGLSQAIIPNSPSPVVAKRNPNTNDFMQVGTVWCNITNNEVFILASITNNSANWVSTSGGAGVFSSLTVTPGPINLTGTTNINIAGAANTSIGNAASTTALVGTVNINTGAGGITSVGSPTNTTDVLGTVNINTNGAGDTEIGVGGTGSVTIGNATGDTFIDAGNLNISAGNVVLGTNNASYTFLNAVKIVSGNGDPNGIGVFTSPIGSLYLNGTPTGPNDRLFVNTDGGTTWTYFAANA